MLKNIIVTGGLGFIGSNLIELLLEKKYFVINIDKATYSSNLYNIKEQERLAQELCNKSFADKVFFCNSGAEATEGLIKLARKYHHIKGDFLKKDIIVLDNDFHGRTIT